MIDFIKGIYGAARSTIIGAVTLYVVVALAVFFALGFLVYRLIETRQIGSVAGALRPGGK